MTRHPLPYSLLEDQFQEIIYLWWDPRDNAFYDPHGARLSNIFELVTPNDILLFRNDHGYNTFPYVKDKTVLCEINVLDDEELEDREDDNQDFEIFCDFWGRVPCRLSCSPEDARRQICYTCSGRN